MYRSRCGKSIPFSIALGFRADNIHLRLLLRPAGGPGLRRWTGGNGDILAFRGRPRETANGKDHGEIPGPARLARNGNFAHRRAASGPCLAFIKMASDHPAAAEVGHGRIDLAADGRHAGAAQVEVAAGGRAARRRHVALEADAGRTA